MAFVTKTWKDRLVEYAGRRKLKNVSTGEEILMDVSRSEGTVSQAGDAFSAANMNNLEQRIKTEFDNVNSSLGGLKFGTDGDGNYGYYGADDSLIPFKSDFASSYEPRNYTATNVPNNNVTTTINAYKNDILCISGLNLSTSEMVTTNLELLYEMALNNDTISSLSFHKVIKDYPTVLSTHKYNGAVVYILCPR